MPLWQVSEGSQSNLTKRRTNNETTKMTLPGSVLATASYNHRGNSFLLLYFLAPWERPSCGVYSGYWTQHVTLEEQIITKSSSCATCTGMAGCNGSPTHSVPCSQAWLLLIHPNPCLSFVLLSPFSYFQVWKTAH